MLSDQLILKTAQHCPHDNTHRYTSTPVHTLTCTHTHMPIHRHTYIHVHTQVHKHTCTHTSMHTCTQCRNHHYHLSIRFMHFEKDFPSPSWSTSASFCRPHRSRPLWAGTGSAPPEAAAEPPEPRRSPSREPPGSCAGGGLPGPCAPVRHAFKTFRSQLPPDGKVCSHRTCPPSCQETEGSGGCSRTFCEEHVGAADAGDGAGQA